MKILKAQEIIDRMPISPVPLTFIYIRRVVNLRGQIHLIMDIKVKSGMEQTRITYETCIIVINMKKHRRGKRKERILSPENRN